MKNRSTYGLRWRADVFEESVGVRTPQAGPRSVLLEAPGHALSLLHNAVNGSLKVMAVRGGNLEVSVRLIKSKNTKKRHFCD
jgi:hypothetical protein